MLEVPFDGVLAEAQPFRNLFVRFSAKESLHDVDLSLCQVKTFFEFFQAHLTTTGNLFNQHHNGRKSMPLWGRSDLIVEGKATATVILFGGRNQGDQGSQPVGL
jgi:hypothetical protein